MLLRLENFRHGEWTLRSEGNIPAATTPEAIRAQVDRLALNHAARAIVDGVMVYETRKLPKARAAAVFGI